jgi:hypothetical protein
MTDLRTPNRGARPASPPRHRRCHLLPHAEDRFDWSPGEIVVGVPRRTPAKPEVRHSPGPEQWGELKGAAS